jgi:hypothetical protein
LNEFGTGDNTRQLRLHQLGRSNSPDSL